MKIKSAKGTKCIIMGGMDGTFIRIYDEKDKGNFVDYNLAHYDFEVEITDDDAFFWESDDDKGHRLDYSPQTLGYDVRIANNPAEALTSPNQGLREYAEGFLKKKDTE